MAEETQVTEATEVAPVEEKKGMGASGFIGGVVGAGGLGYLADGYAAKVGIKKVVAPEAPKADAKEAPKAEAPKTEAAADTKPVEAKKATTSKKVEQTIEPKEDVAKSKKTTAADNSSSNPSKNEPKVDAKEPSAAVEKKESGFKSAVDDILNDKKNAALKEQHEALDAVKAAEGKITKVEVVAAEKMNNIRVTVGKKTHELKGLKTLPQGMEAGKSYAKKELDALVTGDKAAIKTVIAESEKGLIGGIKKAGGIGFGIKNASWTELKGKPMVIAGVVAGGYVGAKVFHAIFGGSHTKKVEEQAQMEAPARG